MKAYWEGDVVCFLRDDEAPHEYMVALTPAELDAERYKWLRDKCTPEDNPQHTWIVEAPGNEWDAAIDAAMLSNVGIHQHCGLFSGDNFETKAAARMAREHGCNDLIEVRPDCNTCANRGRIDGLSQETHCEHCVYNNTWRTNHYAPNAEVSRADRRRLECGINPHSPTKEMKMKLFLISQDQNNDYDTYDFAVVAAPDEETARQIDPVTSWCNGPEHVAVAYIGEAAEEVEQGVVCASFNAG